MPLTGRGASVALAVMVAALALGVGRVVAPLPMAYLTLWVAVALPARLRAIGARNDLSYGLYLYGWPVQQVLVAAGAARWGVLASGAACLAATLPVAALSWWAVEKPAMRLKGVLGAGGAHRSTRHGTSTVSQRVDPTPPGPPPPPD